MARISSPIEEMKEHYDVVVVGSGYGGGIAASRLSRAGQRVCLLERGREIRPGEYPDTVAEATEEMQIHSPDGHVGSHTGMFDFHVQEDLDVLVGCGLGGTSLINANVALRAVEGVWDDERWPSELRGGEGLDDFYRRAETMLGSNPYPDDYPTLPKLEAHRASAEGLDMADVFYKPPINVHFEDGVNVTIGLPIVRTSVDHGTAYDIAGRGLAGAASLTAAVQLAEEIADNRQTGSASPQPDR